jgi:hypothetical protein
MLQDKAGFGSGPAAAVGATARSDPKVAVLVVHGAAAKIGDQGSSSAQVITDLLTYQDVEILKAAYSPPETTNVQFKIGDIAGRNQARMSSLQPKDTGPLYTHELLSDFIPKPYVHKTLRHETVRRSKDLKVSPPIINVHIYQSHFHP